MLIELEVIPGLEKFTEAELRRSFGRQSRLLRASKDGRIAIEYTEGLRALNAMRSVVAAHMIVPFGVPRPRALLGHQNLTRMADEIGRVLRVHPEGAFKTLRVSAAGSESGVLRRLRQELSRALSMRDTQSHADLQVALRRAPDESDGWQMLVRTSPRPLSARAWRVCDFPGALDATVAYAMVQIASPSSSDRFANLFCGSGTLMIERMLIGSTVVCVGVDDSAPTLDCALANLSASGAAGKAALVRASARRTPFPDNTFNTLVADLPFGMNIPTDDIAPLYADAMNEATRISAPGASFVFITTRNRLVESLIEENTDTWSPVGALPIAIPHRRGFIHPVIYHLRRRK